MIRLFKHQNPLSLIGLLILGILVNLNLLFNPSDYIELGGGTILSNWIGQFFEQITFGSYYAKWGLFVFLTFAQSLAINQLSNFYRIVGERSCLVAVVYLLLIGLFNQYLFFTAPFLATFVVLLILYRLFYSYSKTMLSPVFDAVFFCGICSFIYPPFFWLILAVIASFVLSRLFNWKEVIVILIGLVLPFFLFETLLFAINGEMSMEMLNPIRLDFQFDNFSIPESLKPILSFSWLLIMSISSIVFLQSRLLKSTLQSRNMLIMCLCFSLVAYLISIFLTECRSSSIILLFPPLSLLFAYVLNYIKKKYAADIISLLLVSSIVLVQFFLK